MTTTRTSLPSTDAILRGTGLAALAAGAIFAAIQPIHPPDLLASVTTGTWSIIIGLKLAMCLLFLVGISGIYVRQAAHAGWLGLAGFALLTVSWWLQSGFVFAEAFVLPVLAAPAPDFVHSVLAIINPASPATMDVSGLGGIYAVVGITYMLGGLVFGIATLRAGILPRVPAIILAAAATLTPLAALLPHDVQRYAAIPVALAIAWLGVSLWSAGRNVATVAAPTAHPVAE